MNGTTQAEWKPADLLRGDVPDWLGIPCGVMVVLMIVYHKLVREPRQWAGRG